MIRKEVKWIVSITFLILVALLVRALLARNYEFIVYWVVLVALFLVIIVLDKKYKYPVSAVLFFSIWSIMHMSGGQFKINGVRVYDTILVNVIGDPYNIFKYDQLMHVVAYFAISILVYFTLKKHMKINSKALTVVAILAALGIGLLNEIIEFAMVIWADAAAEVGGYYNTALDLVFNFVGAVLGPLYAKMFME
tara:strand:- start:348 stop:929 length:582 start_codon:yes stop_codon:yes gene_type:complete